MVNDEQFLFLSYSRTDSEFALKLANDLRENGINLWIDQLDIHTGDPWDEKVEDALTKADSVVIVLTPEAVESNNVKDEVAFALDENKKIIPILLYPCKIPYRLRRFNYIDFTSDYQTALNRLSDSLSSNQEYLEVIEPPTKELGRDGQFIKFSNGIIKDTKTGLEWIVGPDRDTNWYEAKDWAESLAIDGGGWGMPARNQLKDLYITLDDFYKWKLDEALFNKREFEVFNKTSFFEIDDNAVWASPTSGYNVDFDFKVHTDADAASSGREPPTESDGFRGFAVRNRND